MFIPIVLKERKRKEKLFTCKNAGPESEVAGKILAINFMWQ